jgi:hypothetical protein
MATNYLDRPITHSLIRRARRCGASDAFLAAARVRIGEPIRSLGPRHSEWAACLFRHAILPDGTEEWHRGGRLHRDGGPAVIFRNGGQQWWRHGEFHREGGPATIDPRGREEWWVGGRLHREDGPAVVDPDGSQQWWREGRLHRADGPAVIYADGREEWWIDGCRVDRPA